MAVDIEFNDAVVWYWPKPRSTTVFPNMAELEKVHGQSGKTVVEWLD